MDQSQPKAVNPDNPRGYPEREATCEKHGAYMSRNFLGNVWSQCSPCIEEIRIRDAQRSKEAERKERQDRMLRQSGLAGRFQDATFDNYTAATADQETVLQRCRDYVATFSATAGGGLWLIGPPGTGKTHLGSAMVNALIREHGEWARIHSARDIIRLLRATWGKGNDGGRSALADWEDPTTEDGWLQELGCVPLLVLDELGVGFGSDAENVQLFDVLDQRYKLRRPTILLSNLQPKELKPVMGDRSFDRLREGAEIVPCRWASHRGAKPQAWDQPRTAA